MRLVLLTVLVPLMTPAAARYSARKTTIDGIEVVQLSDGERHAQVSIAPSIGNMAYEFLVNGKNVLWFPLHGPAELKERRSFSGVPFLAPWANRLDADSYWANGKQYRLNPDLGNVRKDNHEKPIHGLLNFSNAWVLTASGSDGHSAWATSQLEFYRYPDLMAQFPFAHTLTMTYRLSNGDLEIETAITNLADEPLPVAVGFHPYFRIHDAPRDQWKIHIGARRHLVLSNLLIPTGASRPVEFADPTPLAGMQFDDGFTDLVRGPDGKSKFWVEGGKERVTVTYGPKYTVAVIYAPPSREFVCFEPMAAITNAFNLAHAGVYKDLQTIPPGGQWKESFWINPSGF
jgi:aldose 1-epimerase